MTMQINSRLVAQGLRCQILTGSFEGNLAACECAGAKDCKLPEGLRAKLKHHKKIVARTKKNWKIFREG